MPTGNESSMLDIYISDGNGQWKKMTELNVIDPKIFYDPDETAANPWCDVFVDWMFYKGSVRSHTSRKRFKKSLMSKGIQRNDAELLCQSIGCWEGLVGYRDVYLHIIFGFSKVRFFDVWNYICAVVGDRFEQTKTYIEGEQA